MKHEVELGLRPVLLHHRLLAVLQDVGTQLDRPRLVVAVHIAEGGREHVPPQPCQRLIDREHIFGGGVQFFPGGSRVINAIFLAPHHPGLDLKNDLVLGTFGQQFARELHVVGEGQLAGVEHVRLEQVVQTGGPPTGGFGDQWLEEAVNLLGLTVVGVECHQHVVLLGEAVRRLGQHNRSERGVLHVQTRSELTPARRDLDDPVGLFVGIALEGGVEGDDGGDIDGRIGVVALLGGIEHGGILTRGGDGHEESLWRVARQRGEETGLSESRASGQQNQPTDPPGRAAAVSVRKSARSRAI